MHIPDGYLGGPPTCIAGYAIMLPLWAIASRRVRKTLQARQVPLPGGSATGSFRRVIAAGIGGYAGLVITSLVAGIEFGIQSLLHHTASGQPLYCPYRMQSQVYYAMLSRGYNGEQQVFEEFRAYARDYVMLAISLITLFGILWLNRFSC